jgi:HD-GYP domain-containing protein (c-di-GMP phosphodiesterase class II)
MPIDPDIAEQERIAAAAERRRAGVERRELAVEVGLGAGWLLAVAAIWVIAGTSGAAIHTVPALACMVCLGVAVHVPFAVGDGYTVPTQLAFVPLLFVLPPALVPLAVIVALIVARLPAVAAGRWPASRLLLIPADAWFSIGPAAVLAAVGPSALHDAEALVIVAAMAAQVAVEVIAWAVRERLLGGAGPREQLAELWVHAVDLAFTPVALVVGLETLERPWAVHALLPLLGVLAIFARERQARLTGLTELNQAYRGTALVLGDVLEADDGYTGAHSRGVVALALEVGEALELDPLQRRNLEFGALLHDVGKVAIPKEIINKPGKLDLAEWAIVKTHTVEGQRMLDRVGGFMRDVGVIVRSHHEWWDGRGYPDGLAGEQIPLEARIVACCDAWNAMTTTRSYRPAMSHAEAVQELRRHRASQFDPRVVDAVLRCVGEDPLAAPRAA